MFQRIVLFPSNICNFSKLIDTCATNHVSNIPCILINCYIVSKLSFPTSSTYYNHLKYSTYPNEQIFYLARAPFTLLKHNRKDHNGDTNQFHQSSTVHLIQSLARGAIISTQPPFQTQPSKNYPIDEENHVSVPSVML